ncbi:GntR family transcriptional regulator [Streptodolium elevatio]|uniref:GntR family transcriptional regulator n=1 Tax=Streptodolium elevatio TaxID=3157996 RepID=A0ABV3DFX7_9ACTN
MLVRVDPGSPRPLHEQIAASVRRAVADGTVEPGERLPAARELAASLTVNVHTVLRAYQQLRDEGLLDLRRGRGAVVAAGADPARLHLAERVADLVRQARSLGLSDDELVTLLRSNLAAP